MIPTLTTTDDFLYIHRTEHSASLARAIPGYRFDAVRNAWEWPLNPETYHDVTNTFDFKPDESITKWLIAETRKKVRVATLLKEEAEAFPDLRYHRKPYPWQPPAIQAGLYLQNHFNLDEVGLGKTFEELIQIDFYLTMGIVKQAWVLCPLSGVRNWKKNILYHAPHLTFTCIEGTPKRKLKLIKEPAQVKLLSVDSAKYLGNAVIDAIGGNLLCLDEVQSIRGTDSWRTESIFKAEPKIRHGLSSTPIMYDSYDMFTLLQWLTGKKEWRNMEEFEDRYVIRKKSVFYITMKSGHRRRTQQNKVAGYQKQDWLRARLYRHSFRREKSEVTNLPPLTFEVRYTQMLTDQWRHYKSLRDECIQTWNNMSEEEGYLARAEVQAKALRLQELTSGFQGRGQRGEPGSKIEYYKSGKEEEFKNICHQYLDIQKGYKVVAFFMYLPPLFQVEKHFQPYGPVTIHGSVSPKGREEANERFLHDDSCRILQAQIVAGGSILDYTPPRHQVVMVFFERHPIGGFNIQAEGRGHRSTMFGRSHVITLVAQDTINEKIMVDIEGRTMDIRNIVHSGNVAKLKELI